MPRKGAFLCPRKAKVMPRIRTYLKSGQIIETNSRITTTARGAFLSDVEWKDIKSGERVIHLDLGQIAAITEVIEPEPSN